MVQQKDSIKEIMLSQGKAQVQGVYRCLAPAPCTTAASRECEQQRLTADTPRGRHCWLQHAEQKPLLLNSPREGTTRILSPSPIQECKYISKELLLAQTSLKQTMLRFLCVEISIKVSAEDWCDGTGHHQD